MLFIKGGSFEWGVNTMEDTTLWKIRLMTVLFFLEKERAPAPKWEFLVFSGKFYLDTTQDDCSL